MRRCYYLKLKSFVLDDVWHHMAVQALKGPFATQYLVLANPNTPVSAAERTRNHDIVTELVRIRAPHSQADEVVRESHLRRQTLASTSVRENNNVRPGSGPVAAAP